MFAKRYAISALVTLPLILAHPAFSAHPDSALRTPAATALEPSSSDSSSSKPETQELSLGSDPRLVLPYAAPGKERWKSDFTSRPAQSMENVPAFLNQRGEYSVNGLSLRAEMGDLRISETPNTVQELSRRGGRLALEAGNADTALRLQTFASSGLNGSGSDALLVGATGEISLLAESARFKTIYLSGREALQPGAKPSDYRERRGDVLGLVAVLEPFKGRLAAEAELDFALFDTDSADEAGAVMDSACRVKVGGEWARYRYNALYERTGPDYRLMGGQGPKRDSEGLSLGVETSFNIHAFDLRLSRHHNNTGNNELHPRLYRYEGLLDYTLKAIETLPLGLRYRKSFGESAREPAGYLAKESEEDAVSGRVNYLAGKWDLGLLASFSQRTDRIRAERESTAATLAFLPKFAAGPVTVAPDFSVRRSMDFPTSLRTDQYAVSLGINGSALEKKLDYELKGGFKKEWAGLANHRKETLGAKVKAAYPFASLFKSAWQPSIGIRGEYNGSSDRLSDRRSNAFSLLFSVEGRSLL
ncbi:MAG: hypothetical protein A2075_08460 [Geobacteraceae bacterium GWC2_58_44]|nr:MAG: hypothetical protein A2075_08460 [Geobacteraceae bacterium GWC2_58_44]